MSKVLLVLVLLLGAAAAYVATRPDAYHVERSTTVDAPAATVFAQIDDLSVWKEWSPWEKKDPAMKRTLSATTSGVGATYSWEGNKEVGKGKMTIVDSRPGEKVGQKLEFIEPFQSQSEVYVHAQDREPDDHQGDLGDERQAQLRHQGDVGGQADGRHDRQGLRGGAGEPQEGRRGEEAAARATGAAARGCGRRSRRREGGRGHDRGGRQGAGGRQGPGGEEEVAARGRAPTMAGSTSPSRQNPGSPREPGARAPIAAAIVLGEIGAHDAAVIDALAGAAAGGVAPVQRHALEALARLATAKNARRAYAEAAAVFRVARGCRAARGDRRGDRVRRRGRDADSPAAGGHNRPHRAARPGRGARARRRQGRVFGVLAALDTTDVDAARAGALAARQRVKDATPREKAGYLAQVAKLLRAKGRPSKKGGNPALVAGGLKILGYLEDPAALPTLLAFARDKRQPLPVREEAIVALRFTARGKAAARVATALMELAERAPAELARPALYSMASLEIPNALVGRLKKLAIGTEAERALLAIERLRRSRRPWPPTRWRAC